MTNGGSASRGWALILGASSGFGAATARSLAGAGHHIVGVHLDLRATKAAAIGNAVFHATGKRIRSMPLKLTYCMLWCDSMSACPVAMSKGVETPYRLVGVSTDAVNVNVRGCPGTPMAGPLIAATGVALSTVSATEAASVASKIRTGLSLG